jgi:hypothetical protein
MVIAASLAGLLVSGGVVGGLFWLLKWGPQFQRMERWKIN